MTPLLRALAIPFLALALGATAAAAAPPKEFFVYFGTYTNNAKSKGIYRATLDVASGKLSAAEVAAECVDPAFLALHPNGKFLYAIDERADPVKTPGRGVSAYALDAKTGGLTLLNQQGVGGPGPCHLSVDATGKCVLVANYGGGSVSALPIGEDGRLAPATATIQHKGSSVNPARQKEPHAHAIEVAPDNRFALVPDLGLDKIMIYKLDAAKASLRANDPAFAALPPGSGPRHLAFHPNGKCAYVINELTCTMSVFAYDARRGALSEVQSISTLPPGETVQRGQSTAEVIAHPNGKFLFGSNRGHNTIVVYAVDAATGKLTLVEHQATQGRNPRHFAVDPTGAWLLAENQGSDTVVVFRIDSKSGKLTPTGQSLEVPVPVAAVFVPVK